jgi:hypothetical protein
VSWGRRRTAQIGDVPFVPIVRAVEGERTAIETTDPKNNSEKAGVQKLAFGRTGQAYCEQVTHGCMSGHDGPLERPGVEQIVEPAPE